MRKQLKELEEADRRFSQKELLYKKKKKNPSDGDWIDLVHIYIMLLSYFFVFFLFFFFLTVDFACEYTVAGSF